ncbi:AcrR family transcriptional regulator [Microlunatus panaciterrae]|uniref:AcrR family transcriptional regulator n=1 Tax=Microlunatus panaciterrae TaxID=400768 RepID=A0ABS2RGN1_9ACTN|nr:AcrR family transcriptional regulator [Microlunatus panaciterrae]
MLEGAVTIADADGIGALTIRSLAQHLGVKPMSLYYYVANKSEILDAMVDIVFSAIDVPAGDGGDWRSEIRLRATSARDVLSRHSWAIGLLDSRTSPGPDTMRHHDAMLGTLRAAGFTIETAAHAYVLINSYVYGFALQEAALPFDGPDAGTVAVPMIQQRPDGEHPHLRELATRHIPQPGNDLGDEFDFGLNLILDALSRLIPG